jgi:XTP/dITP diphosphohydrolase
MTALIFATNNRHKIEELLPLLPPGLQLITLKQAGIAQDIPEPHHTLEANAREKMEVIYRLTGKDCFSEDTGLEVEALGGAPGVRSARYAGEGATHAQNIGKLLQALEGSTNRRARFRTVIALQYRGAAYYFEGICPGQIALHPMGEGGFGYDPVFIPDGDHRSFAQMTLAEKSRFSHRARAVAALIGFLNTAAGQAI